MITEVERQLVTTYVNAKLAAYKNFIGINEMPEFEVELLELTTSEEQNGYGNLAAHHYSVTEDKHTLKVWKDIYKSVLHADKFISRSDFLDNIRSMSYGFGMFFNHLGRISICEMYANDYEQNLQKIENIKFENDYIEEEFSKMKELMNKFLNETEIIGVGQIYFPVVLKVANKFL